MPSARSVCSLMVWPAPLASAVCRLAVDQGPLRRRPAVVERRLADEFDLDGALQAADRAHQHVVSVVVGGRPGVRRDLVLGLLWTHGQRVADHDPARRRLPRRDRTFVPGSYARAVGWLIPNGPSLK